MVGRFEWSPQVGAAEAMRTCGVARQQQHPQPLTPPIHKNNSNENSGARWRSALAASSCAATGLKRWTHRPTRRLTPTTPTWRRWASGCPGTTSFCCSQRAATGRGGLRVGMGGGAALHMHCMRFVFSRLYSLPTTTSSHPLTQPCTPHPKPQVQARPSSNPHPHSSRLRPAQMLRRPDGQGSQGGGAGGAGAGGGVWAGRGGGVEASNGLVLLG